MKQEKVNGSPNVQALGEIDLLREFSSNGNIPFLIFCFRWGLGGFGRPFSTRRRLRLRPRQSQFEYTAEIRPEILFVVGVWGQKSSGMPSQVATLNTQTQNLKLS